MTLVEAVLSGERLALARLLTQVENDTAEGRVALGELFPYTGKAHLIGVTGAPGTGKSSLVNQLARYYRNPGHEQLPHRVAAPLRVAIVAVDPASPFTGGALLGDRVRMRDLSGDPGVFIRSMSARGSLGGLAPTTASLVQVFDAAGFEVIMIETVGAGQAEVDIARLAHTTLVVEAPGLGDDIQAIKAGILEIADILVVNKADRPGVENTERALRGMLQLAHPVERNSYHHGHILEENSAKAGENSLGWETPIFRTVATEGAGIADLAGGIQRHREYLTSSGAWEQRERARLQNELDMLLQTALLARWRAGMTAVRYQGVLDRLVSRQLSPHQAVEALMDGDAGR